MTQWSMLFHPNKAPAGTVMTAHSNKADAHRPQTLDEPRHEQAGQGMVLGAGHVQGMAEAAHGVPLQQHADRLRIDEVAPLAPAIQQRDGLAVDRLQLLPPRFQLGLDFLQLHARTAFGRFGNGGRFPLGVLHFLLGGDLLGLEALGDVLPGLFILPQHGGMLGLESLDRLLAQRRLLGLGRRFLRLIAGGQRLLGLLIGLFGRLVAGLKAGRNGLLRRHCARPPADTSR